MDVSLTTGTLLVAADVLADGVRVVAGALAGVLTMVEVALMMAGILGVLTMTDVLVAADVLTIIDVLLTMTGVLVAVNDDDVFDDGTAGDITKLN